MKSVHIDGALVFGVAFFGAVLAAFSADSVYHYVSAAAVFWIKSMSGALGAGCTALIGFRSKVFARYSDAQQPPLSPVAPETQTPPKP